MAIAQFLAADHGVPTISRRLIQLRWGVLLAEAVMVVTLPSLADLALPWATMLLVIALQAGANAWSWQRLKQAATVGAWELSGQLAVDIVALAVLMFFSGGAANPVISLLLPPVAIAALALPARLAAGIAALAVLAYSVLMEFNLPLAIGDVARATRLHLLGMWFTFVVSAVMMTWFVGRMKAAIRARDAELAEVREQALRDERVVALGVQAAGAAHELSTPLATMAIIAGDIERDERLPAETLADIVLLRRQITACKEIISRMAERAGVGRVDSVQAVMADQWLRGLFGRWQALRPQARARLDMRGAGPAPAVAAEVGLEQGLLNLFNNAADAGADVVVILDWLAHEVMISVRDNGPGFPQHILASAGRAPQPTHAGGAGIGLFLAKAAIERMGGRLELDNDGGGVARVFLPCDKGEA